MSMQDGPGWNSGWAALLLFVHARGTAQVPTRAVANGIAVGRWVSDRRAEYWAGKLAPDRVARLEGLPGWDWTAPRARDGRVASPHSPGTPSGTAPRWLRRTPSSGRSAWVSGPGAAGELHGRESPGPAGRPARGAAWLGMDGRGRALGARAAGGAGLHRCARHPRCRPGHGGGWLPARTMGPPMSGGRPSRHAHRRPDRRLEPPAGMATDRLGKAMESGDRGTVAISAEHGDAVPPQKTVVDGFPLGMWVHQRRQQYRRGQLPRRRVADLESIPGWQWTVAGKEWDRAYAVLQRYAAEHRSATPPAGTISEGIRIADWAASQRRRRREHRLPARRVDQLQALPGWTW